MLQDVSGLRMHTSPARRAGCWKRKMRDPDNMLLQQGWSPEFLSTANLEAVQTEYEVLHLMRQCANHFRFSHFLVSRFPANEQQRFAERLLVRGGSVCLNSFLPIGKWFPALFMPRGELSAAG